MKTTIASTIILLFMCCHSARAQSSSIGNFSMVVDTAHQTVTIELIAPEMIYNLLVRINISGGRTIFLDNKYKFSGHYHQLIELSGLGKGIYALEIIKDNEHIYQTIIL